MIIDIHAHVFANPLMKLRPEATPFMSAAQQIAVMDAKGIDKAVILPLTGFPGEPQSLGELLDICGRYPGRFIPFCNPDPQIGKRAASVTARDFSYKLEQFRDHGCRGVGEVVARIPFDDPRVLALFEACEQIGFPVTFHTVSPEVDSYGLIDEVGLPRFERVLRNFPKLVFLGHSQAFWSEISGDLTYADKDRYPEGAVKPGGRLIELMRRYPQLHGDLSAGSGLNALRRDPAHAFAFIEEFQDRLLLGLDYCSVVNDLPHIEWLTAQRDAGHIRPEVLEKLFWRNAARVLRLEIEGEK